MTRRQQYVKGDRVVLNDRAKAKDCRGRTGTVVLVLGIRPLRWAVVDLDLGLDVTCRMSELDPGDGVVQAP